MGESFESFFRRATSGFEPYAYQRRIAEDGLPAVLDVPVGSGRTAAAVLPWLWRLLVAPGTPAAAPHRLVYALPSRALVEPTLDRISGWLAALGLTDTVGPHLLMGGVDREDDEWQMWPATPAIFVGTQDMVLSRALMRGYAEPRSHWPISYGLLHAGTQWVFDGAPPGPVVATGTRLQELRDALGTAAPTATMWMPTVPDAGLRDLPAVRLTEADETGPLGGRMRTTRRVARAELPGDPPAYPAAVAALLADRHRPGTRTVAMLNTVDRAVRVYEALRASVPEERLLLVHPWFRRAERRRTAEVLSGDVPSEGRIVIGTQTLEAGLGVSARVVFTETAPWHSIARRAGHCDGDLLWSPPPAPFPYEPADLAPATAALAELEGREVTSRGLRDRRVTSAHSSPAVIRRRDLLRLFDTLPGPSGADVEVSPWIADGDDRTAFVAWRAFSYEADPEHPDRTRPAPDPRFPGSVELCPAPLTGLREMADRLWMFDHVDGAWRQATGDDLVPGAVFVADAATGGYDPVRGWAPEHRAPVAVLDGRHVAEVGPEAGEPPRPGITEPAHQAAVRPAVELPSGTAARSGERPEVDRGSTPDAADGGDLVPKPGRWITLLQHSADVERETAEVLASYAGRLTGLTERQAGAAALAGRYHDIGKAHPVFQAMLRSAALPEDPDPGPGPWAKSGRGGGRHERPHFRHELVSVLMLEHPGCAALDDVADPDLVAYLVGAHHGKVRMTVRPLPEETEHHPPHVLGVRPGDLVPGIDVPGGGTIPELAVDPGPLTLDPASGRDAGDGDGSWAGRARRLRDRPDLGPFRLAFLESVVRMADWRASRSYREPPA